MALNVKLTGEGSYCKTIAAVPTIMAGSFLSTFGSSAGTSQLMNFGFAANGQAGPSLLNIKDTPCEFRPSASSQQAPS